MTSAKIDPGGFAGGFAGILWLLESTKEGSLGGSLVKWRKFHLTFGGSLGGSLEGSLEGPMDLTCLLIES